MEKQEFEHSHDVGCGFLLAVIIIAVSIGGSLGQIAKAIVEVAEAMQ